MQKIIPHLWFDKEAKEAAEFYVATFEENSKIHDLTIIHNTPSGDCDFLTFEILGHTFMAISAGPYFKINPSISFHIKCPAVEEVDKLHAKLSKGGMSLMELGEYPFSKRYAWVQDKYGVSWQIIYTEPSQIKQRIVPAFMFVGDVYGKAEEAMNDYISIFSGNPAKQNDSKVDSVMYYENSDEYNKAGTVQFASFELEGQEFGTMDSGFDHKFQFNEAISLLVDCDNQEEIDYYWERLSAVPGAEQCGWLKDKYGVSWQINPKQVNRMLKDEDLEKVSRVTQAFLKMKKFDIAELEKAYKG